VEDRAYEGSIELRKASLLQSHTWSAQLHKLRLSTAHGVHFLSRVTSFPLHDLAQSTADAACFLIAWR
jgi:hypothetical protein